MFACPAFSNKITRVIKDVGKRGDLQVEATPIDSLEVLKGISLMTDNSIHDGLIISSPNV